MTSGGPRKDGGLSSFSGHGRKFKLFTKKELETTRPPDPTDWWFAGGRPGRRNLGG
jgi:hypothetical protein